MSSLLFPGQGSQTVGMGLEFYENFDLVKKIFKLADERLDFPISKMILEGPSEQLQLTKNTQPAILVVSYSIFKVLRDEFNFDLKSIKYFAGHSLGEYSALVCSGALEFNDALYLLHERGKAMQNAVPVNKGSMIAILGLELEEINNLLKNNVSSEGICEIANDNAHGQVIISGNKEVLDKFKITLKNKNIKHIPLKVSAPFHCSLMQPAAETMKNKIDIIKFSDPAYEIVANVTAKAVKETHIIKKLLIDQIFSTVRWRESLIYMSKSGVKNFIEIGPGKALTGMAKRTIKNSNCFSINSIADIKNLINESKK